MVKKIISPLISLEKRIMESLTKRGFQVDTKTLKLFFQKLIPVRGAPYRYKDTKKGSPIIVETTVVATKKDDLTEHEISICFTAKSSKKGGRSIPDKKYQQINVGLVHLNEKIVDGIITIFWEVKLSFHNFVSELAVESCGINYEESHYKLEVDILPE